MSFKYTTAAALQAYVRTYGVQLITRGFYGFASRDIISLHENVKGQKILTRVEFQKIVRRWQAAFSAPADLVEFKPETLLVQPARVDMEVVPQEWEESYLGHFRKPGFTVDDYPFEAYLMDQKLAAIASEFEDAIWSGVAAGSPAATDTLDQLFDGFLHQIADLITATTLTPVATGAIAESTAVDQINSMVDQLHAVLKARPTVCYMSMGNAAKYIRNYKDKFGKYTERKIDSMINTGVQLDEYPCTVIGVPGMGTSGRVIVTPVWNMAVGTDQLTDMDEFHVERRHRTLEMSLEFKAGAQIAYPADTIIVVNDQA